MKLFWFVYHSDTGPGSSFPPRTVFDNFIAMQSDTKLFSTYSAERNAIPNTRCADLKAPDAEEITGVASLLDGIARQRAIDEPRKVLIEAE